MSKKRLLYAFSGMLIVLFPLLTNAQDSADSAIHFDSGLSWSALQAKAKAENKYIFMDCFATWCGPCKWMSQHIFTQKEVADFFNTHFINVAVQMDRTPKDLQAVRDWYPDVDSIKEEYKIQDYPTYLFFSPDGIIVHRLMGTTGDSRAFIAKAVDALDPSRQSYTIARQWERHKTDSAFLWEAFNAAQQAGDYGLAKPILEAYLNCQPDLLIKRNLQLIASWGLSKSSQDKWFHLFLNNAARVNDSLVDNNGIKNPVAWVLRRVIRVEELQPLYDKHEPIYWEGIKNDLRSKYPQLGRDIISLIEDDFIYNIGIDVRVLAEKKEDPAADWSSITMAMKKNYPDYDIDPILWRQKVKILEDKKNWAACAQAVYDFMHRYGGRVSVKDINNMAWNDVFEHCDDPRMLSAATKWMRRVVGTNENSEEYLDTYANLLYKTGNKAEALKWEERALGSAEKNHASARDLKGDQDNLEKMRQGKPTWGS
jgi:thiol-disulfide isomerase/thioredoxin